MSEMRCDPGPIGVCDGGPLGAYWQPGRWTRDKLRGHALRDHGLRDEYGIEPDDIFAASFGRGWVLEVVEHDGEWCDPRWPVYRFTTIEPGPGSTAVEASWLLWEIEPVR